MNSTEQYCSWKVDQLTPVPGFVGHRLCKFRAVFYLPCFSLKASIYFLKLWVPVERNQWCTFQTLRQHTQTEPSACWAQLRDEEFLGLLEEQATCEGTGWGGREYLNPYEDRWKTSLFLLLQTKKPNPCILCFFKLHRPPPPPRIFIKEMQTHVLQDGRCKRTFCTIISRLSQTSFTCNHLSGGC